MARRKLTSVRWWLATFAVAAGMAYGSLPGCLPEDDVKRLLINVIQASDDSGEATPIPLP